MLKKTLSIGFKKQQIKKIKPQACEVSRMFNARMWEDAKCIEIKAYEKKKK